MDWTAAAALLAVGALAGILSTLFGIGGGLVMVPTLHYGLGVPWAPATATSLLAIAVQSPTGVWQHARRGAVSWSLALPMCLSGLAGVVVGDLLQPRVPVPWLKVLFAGVMVLAAWRLAGKVTPRPGERLGQPGLYALGFVAGVVSKLLGIGGGLLTVPVLALAGVPVHLAVGSSLVPVFTNAAVASAQALAAGFDASLAVPLAAGALMGVPLGARIAHALKEGGLRRAFAVALVAGAAYVGLTSGAW